MTIQRTTLDNGLTIITDSMEVASFTLGIWVDIGFTERMGFSQWDHSLFGTYAF